MFLPALRASAVDWENANPDLTGEAIAMPPLRAGQSQNSIATVIEACPRSGNVGYFRYTDRGYAMMSRSARLIISANSFGASARKNRIPRTLRSRQASAETYF